MAIEIKVPALGESVTEATVAKWLKHPGEAVAIDEPLVELETDKVNVEVPAPAAGILAEIAAEEGTNLPVGGLLGRIGDATAVPAPHPTPLEATLPLPSEQTAASADQSAAASTPRPNPLRPRGEREKTRNAPRPALAGRGRDPRSGRVRGSARPTGRRPSIARRVRVAARRSRARGRRCANWWRKAGSIPPQLRRAGPATALPRPM
jgi:2-oxoglutarate dehydrogenase E2 component (dihydrolipoamide succinyltransferase)